MLCPIRITSSLSFNESLIRSSVLEDVQNLVAECGSKSAVADLRGFDLRGALNQGHSRNTRQGPELPSLTDTMLPLTQEAFRIGPS
jgi:hypothetical protein